MDFILNSKTKKVEIFYENAAEQQAILEFMSRYLTYREDKTSPNICINDPGISWTNAVSTTPYTLSTTDDLIGTITLGSNLVTTPVTLSSTTDSTLDTSSSESSNSCITAYVPRKTK